MTAVDTAVLDHLDTDAVVALTQQLVRIRSVNDHGATVVEAPVADVVADLMRGFGWPVTVTEVAPGRPNVVAVVQGSAPGRTLMFEGHSDVVTPGDDTDWTFDPFAGDIVDGRLRGRGAADMKSGVAAMIHAARAVELAGFTGRLVVGVLADEEGMMRGAKHFAASPAAYGVDGPIDGVIVCEPEGGEICPVTKGAVRLRVDIHGRMAHGAMPQMGRNPVPVVARLILGLAELEQQLGERYPAHPDLGPFYLTPTVLAAGSAEQVNVIPALASVYLDLRTLPGMEHEGLVQVIGLLADQVADESGVTARVTVIDDRPPVDTDRDAPVVQALVTAHAAVGESPVVFGGVPGSTDGTILTRDAGLETVVYGPGGKWIAHQADEYADVSDILRCARVFAVAAAGFLAAP
ncbi:M20 family metallopeptidase [Nakamurella deserti]|uniref:M20 family metallopeptidase n=1 Tax=Nakamurella deserti TaxID=2164074 RepID=UPI000DBE773B|nr:M20 family metallopeptidase [Nakamurella deserti]